MGPKGYETLNAFVQMTDDELKQANELFAQSLTLGDSQSAIVNDGFDRIGKMAVAGYANGIGKDGEATAATEGFAEDQIEAAEEKFGVASPSKVFITIGYYCVMGLRNGIIKNTFWAVDAVDYLATKVLNKANAEFMSVRFEKYGRYISEGIAKGIRDNIGVIEAAASEAVYAAEGATRRAGEISSPSKMMARLGAFMTEGLAVGMVDAAYTVEKAASSVVDSTYEAYDNALSSVQDYADLNTTLLLTPILDMSYLDEQLSGLDQTIGVSGQNGGNFSATPSTGNTVNFTQNNYSPKALSRIDIYRQTKNQVSMLKGATAYA